MKVKSLQIRDFRNIEAMEFEPSEGVNVIFGDLIVDAGGNPVGLGILAFVLLFAGRCFLGPEPKDSRDSYSW